MIGLEEELTKTSKSSLLNLVKISVKNKRQFIQKTCISIRLMPSNLLILAG